MSTADQPPTRLFPHHLEELRKSGLTDETIRAAKIYSEASVPNIASLLGWKVSAKMAPALVFPYKKPGGANGQYRLKPDRPRSIGGKPVKYETPKGAVNELYIPPGTFAQLENPQTELIVTEGEKKALCADQYGFRTIGLVGVYGWKPKKQERLLPDFDRIVLKDRPVFIAFDSDVDEKAEVQDAESRLAAHLKNRGARVKVVRIPPGPAGDDGKPTKRGLDDFLVADGPGGLRKLLDAATDPAEPDTIEMKAEARDIDPALEAAGFLRTTHVDGVHRLRYWHGAPWVYKTGCYRQRSSDEIKAKVTLYLNEGYRNVKNNALTDVMNQVRAMSMLGSDLSPPAWIEDPPADWPADEILATKNGLIHLPSFAAGQPCLISPTPRLFITAALNYDFDVEAGPPVEWLSFLDRLWPGDPQSVATLQEWFGYSLLPDTRQQKILLVIGPTRSGKGTIGRILRAMVGADNVVAPTLSSLTTNFGLWPLLGKSVAIVADARLSGRPDVAVIVERLLSISGEDPQTIDRKNLEQITTKLSTRFMLLTNELPKLSDASGAMAARMLILRLTKSWLNQEDTSLFNKIIGELPSILLWSVEGWRRLTERGRFVEPASSSNLRGALKDLTSPIAAFVEERCIIGPGETVAKDKLYESYKSWCQAAGKKVVDDSVFGRNLRAILPAIEERRPTKDDGQRVRIFKGIGLVW